MIDKFTAAGGRMEEIDKEVEAIKAVLTALEPLSSQLRFSVIEYVMKRLGVNVGESGQNLTLLTSLQNDTRLRPAVSEDVSGAPLHIKAFKESKKPRSANEMSALVAYYLSDLAPPQNRKRTINTKDLETYFKIADFPLPDFRFTLNNAKAAGYFDAVGEGEYKLNAVGHNLVVHSLPRVNGRTTTKKKRHVPKKKSTQKSRSTAKKTR